MYTYVCHVMYTRLNLWIAPAPSCCSHRGVARSHLTVNFVLNDIFDEYMFRTFINGSILVVLALNDCFVGVGAEKVREKQ